MKANQKQLHILRHSLGLDDDGKGRQYRNYFATSEGSDDWQHLQELVAGGLMHDHGPVKMWGDMHGFTVTKAGKYEVACQHPATPRLTKSQQRYRDFLKSDCGEGFGAWLKRRHA